jgi:hypothetical protein
MCKGWVVRGHRREFLDVDQWGRKDNLGESVYVGWTLSAETFHGSSLRIGQMW